jgi:hypothetical protein
MVARGEVVTLSCPMNETNRSSPLWPLAIVILFACVVNYPCLLWGLQFGHDHNLHITYLHFFDAQLAAGELYPRWVSGLNFGAGGPIFFVQYPLPYYAAAGLRRIFRLSETADGLAYALGAFVFFVGIVSGVSSWLWCRGLANPVAAIFTSVAYLTMPYLYGGDVYYRASIGEYSALAVLPLALFFADQIESRPWRAVSGMALVIGVVILCNLFTAILFAPFLFLYAIFLVSRTNVRIAIFVVAAALVLGVGISGVYFLPMNTHRAFFNLANLVKLREGIFAWRSQLFPFGETLFPGPQISLRIVGLLSRVLGLAIVAILIIRLRHSVTSKTSSKMTSKGLAYAAVALVLLTCAAPLLHRVGFFPHAELGGLRIIDVRTRIFLITFLTLEAALLAYTSLQDRAERLPNFLLAACLVCYFLSTRWSEWIWGHASFLWNLQFPWRLSGILSTFALGLFALALRDAWDNPRRRRNALLAGTALWLGVGTGSYLVFDIPQVVVRPFFTEVRDKLESSYPAYASVSELPTPDEFGGDESPAGRVSFRGGIGTASFGTVTARHLRLEANCSAPCTLLLKLVYYPFWQAQEVSKQSVCLKPSGRAGLTELSLGSGNHQVDLELPFGRSEIWGAWLSLVSLVVVAWMFFQDRRRKSLPASAGPVISTAQPAPGLPARI